MNPIDFIALLAKFASVMEMMLKYFAVESVYEDRELYVYVDMVYEGGSIPVIGVKADGRTLH